VPDTHESSPLPDPALYRPGGPDPFLSGLADMNRARAALVRRLGPPGPVLDAGCGLGFFVRSAADAGLDAIGTDLSEGAVRYARERLGVRAEAAPFESFAAAGRRFGAVTLWHVLEHFEDPLSRLKDILALLAPGGFVVAEVPNFHSVKFVLSGRRWEGGNHPLFHRTFFTARTLCDLLRRAGFVDVRRVALNYPFSGRGMPLGLAKRGLNAVALDAFLCAAGIKGRE
jgi:SAM-dependent methyltransferase